MKIRLEGTGPELAEAVPELRKLFRISSVSRPYKNRDNELYRVYVDAELPSDKYKAIIRLKDSVGGELLAALANTIEKAFVNRAGSLQNVSDSPREFVFQGDESHYGCLDLGMLDLREIPGFLEYVESWDWVDTDPSECCNMLEVFARHPLNDNGDPALTPSPGGEKCRGNGKHLGIECCCDECDRYLLCFPDWREQG